MKRALRITDKRDVRRQLERILAPSRVVDVAFDARRMVVYAAVEYHAYTPSPTQYMPDGQIYAIAATIYDGDVYGSFYDFEVTSDELWSESYLTMEKYCHCPARILRKLTSPRDAHTAAWRQQCKQNAKRTK